MIIYLALFYNNNNNNNNNIILFHSTLLKVQVGVFSIIPHSFHELCFEVFQQLFDFSCIFSLNKKQLILIYSNTTTH